MLQKRWMAIALAAASAAFGQTKTVTQVPGESPTPLYVSNKAPLAVSPLVKLPIGRITVRGWLRKQLELEADGMGGRLPEVSQWCHFDNNAWADPKGEGKNGWEELPYWLKGYGDLGYVLNDPRIIAETKKWIDAIIVAQQDDGWFGPIGLKTAYHEKKDDAGKPDLWPHMPVLNALQSYYEWTETQGKPDERVINLMKRYFAWELACPDDQFMKEYWGRMRTGDNLESVYWLYNRTGEASLLQLAEKLWQFTPRQWMTGLPMTHNVNVAQGFRVPAEYWVMSHDDKFLKGTDHAYHQIMDPYGQVPGGGFGADENARKGYGDPRQGFETCGMVEFMHSFEMLTKMTADPTWADRCEDVAFNDFPAAMTPDLKQLHYLTSPNSVQLDHGNHAPDIQNGGEMLSFSPGKAYRCCQHNHTMGWPYYAEELWLATADQGACASLYADCSATVKVAGGTDITIDEKTDYPFDGVVTMTMSWSQDKPISPTFPLYLRIPKWCDASTVKINGTDTPIDSKAGTFAVVNRKWNNGDIVTLNLPMHLAVRKWEKNKDSVSVDYGPLTYALKIGEQYKQYASINGWKAEELYATTPWNYGLELDPADPAKGIEVVKKPGPIAAQPWTTEEAPIELHVKARKIDNWKMDRLNMVGLLQQSPVKTDAPVETVTLIPMGCARLRISQFPTVTTAPDGHEWGGTAVLLYKATASHAHDGDTTDAMQDGILPDSSHDETIPRFTWWDHRGTQEWVAYEFGDAKDVSATQVYWFDDAGTGNCRVPTSWTLEYLDGSGWKPVEGASDFGLDLNKMNRVTFKSVHANGLRIKAQLKPNYSGGILEWKVGG